MRKSHQVVLFSIARPSVVCSSVSFLGLDSLSSSMALQVIFKQVGETGCNSKTSRVQEEQALHPLALFGGLTCNWQALCHREPQHTKPKQV